MTADVERRFVDLQATITGRKLAGYGAVFNETTDVGPYLERIAPTAFDAALASPGLDVRGLFNHNPDYLLARTTNGSLRLSTDSTGLQFELDLPDTSVGNDVRWNVESGLLTGCSFGFVADQQDWTQQDGRDLRTHISVGRLFDVSVVTYPAYEGTSVSLRSIPRAIDGRTQILCARARVNRKVP